MIEDFEPKRIAFVGDWHRNLTWAKSVMNALADEGVEAIVHAGDFGYWPNTPAGVDFLNAIASRAREKNCDMPVFWVDGNHEDHWSLRDAHETAGTDRIEPLEVAPRVYHVPRGLRWEWGGVRFMGLGGAASVDKSVRTVGMDWFPEEELSDADLYAAVGDNLDPRVDVMVTHDTISFTDSYRVPNIPPDEFWPAEAMDRSRRHQARLRSAVEAVQPTHLFHGHFHSRYGAEVEMEWGTMFIAGLDCDGARIPSWNWAVVDLEALREDVDERRAAA